MTNLEYLRSLSAEELANKICGCPTMCRVCAREEDECSCNGCMGGIVEWLNQEYKPALRNCPFCGGKALLYDYASGSFVRCGECYTQTNEHGTEAEAIKAWNRRV